MATEKKKMKKRRRMKRMKRTMIKVYCALVENLRRRKYDSTSSETC